MEYTCLFFCLFFLSFSLIRGDGYSSLGVVAFRVKNSKSGRFPLDSRKLVSGWHHLVERPNMRVRGKLSDPSHIARHMWNSCFVAEEELFRARSNSQISPKKRKNKPLAVLYTGRSVLWPAILH